MNNIKIKTIPPPIFELWRENNGAEEFIGDVNEYEALDVRVQIRNEQQWGYYFNFYTKDRRLHRIRIDRNGECEDYPEGFFDTFSNLLLKLL
jgi:hypothetical protein